MTDLLQEDGNTLLLLEDGVDNLELQDVITPYGVVTDMVVQTPDGPKEMLPRVRWNGTWSPGTYYNMQMVTDGNYQAIANKTTTDRPAPQPSGDTYYPTEGATWVDQSNNVATITYENLYNIQSGFFFEYILLDVAAANVGYLHELTVLTDGVLSGRATWTPETADPVTLNLGGVLVPSSTGTLQIACKVTRSSGVGLGWAEDVGHWTGYSSTEISSAIDILVTPATISEDWDVTAVSGGSGGGGGGSGTPSPLTTKGDIWSYSNTDARFPVSTTQGQVITVDTAEPFGFKWKNIPYAPQGEVAFNYNYSDTITPVGIASGEIRLDNTDLSLATKLYISDITNAGNDVTVFLSEFVQGNYLSLYQTTPGNATVSYQITAGSTPVDQGTYWEYDVTFLFETAADNYTNGEPVQLIKIGNPADRIPEGGLVGQVMVKSGTDPYDLQWGGTINFYDSDRIVDPFSVSADGGTYLSQADEDQNGRFSRYGTHTHDYDAGFGGGVVIPALISELGTHIIGRDGNPFGMGFLFDNQADLKNPSGIPIAFTPFYTLNASVTYVADGASCTSSTTYDVFSQTRFSTENAGTLAVTSWNGFVQTGNIGAGVTLQEKRTVWRLNPTVNGTLERSAIIHGDHTEGSEEASIANFGFLYGQTLASAPTGNYFLYQATDSTHLNVLGATTFFDRTGTAVNNAAFDSSGKLVQGSAVFTAEQTNWIVELAEDFIKVTGSTVPTAWTTIHTETILADEAVRGTFLAVAKRTDAKGYSYSEKKYVVWEDGGTVLEDDTELYEVGSGIAFAETRININGMDIEFQVRSVTGDWDWDVTIFNKDIA
jgi:hypothetical protein